MENGERTIIGQLRQLLQISQHLLKRSIFALALMNVKSRDGRADLLIYFILLVECECQELFVRNQQSRYLRQGMLEQCKPMEKEHWIKKGK